MLIILHILLLLKIGRCIDDQVFETTTVDVGQNVTLTCARDKSWHSTNLYWIRVVSGTFPDFLGGTITYDVTETVNTRRIAAKQQPGKFVLHIRKTQLSDTAIYYCIKVKKRKMTFVRGVFLRIKGPHPDITAITQDLLSDPVHPGDPETLQCSVLSNSEDKMFPGDHSVFWFRAESDESHPSLIYAHRNSGDECEITSETPSAQKCVYSFSKNISSSDAGTYFCAVATCGEILFGNGTKLDIEEISKCDPQTDNIIVPLLCAALALSLIIIALLIFVIRKKSCNHCNDVATLQTNPALADGNQQLQPRNEETLVYSAPIFTRGKVGKSGRRSARNEETIYTNVRV